MKIKSSLIKAKENQFKHDLDYEEYLQDNPNELDEDEIENMEKVFCKATIIKNYQPPLNNLYYQPLQGA